MADPKISTPESGPARSPNSSGEFKAQQGQAGAKGRRVTKSDSEESDSVVVRRNRRIGNKVEQAKALLESLTAKHPQRRLLHAAIVRRDEVLLDGLLSELCKE